MPVSLERLRSSYLPVFYKKDVPIVRLVEDGTEQQQQQQGEQVIISRKKRILEWISGLVLTESQKEKAENIIPIFIPLLSMICAFNYMSDDYLRHFFFDDHIIRVLKILSTLLIGTPLEVAHGKFKIFLFLLVTIAHSHLLNYYDRGQRGFFDRYIFSYDERPVSLALASIHLTNIFMNWNEMKYKVHRFIIILVLLGRTPLLDWVAYLINFQFLRFINILYTVSFIDGIIFGYFWFYGNKNSLLKYALIIMTIAVIGLTYAHLLNLR